MKKKLMSGMCIAVCILSLFLAGCGSDEYTTDESVKREEHQTDSESVRAETEAENAERIKKQAEIAQAKAEVQKQSPSSELVIEDGIGTVGVSSSSRSGILIPTYFYFPKDYNPEETYPLVVMFAGFAADHDNGTRFDEITEEMNKNGLLVVQYDVPGYGESEETNLAYTLTNVKRDALDVINYTKSNFNIGKVGAFGYDVGGRVVMEMQVDKLYDFDQIELIGPYSETSEFVHACFGEQKWVELRAKAKDEGLAKFGDQEYSLQWFTDWDDKADTLTDDFCKVYKNRRTMIVYSLRDDCVNPKTMDKMYKAIGAAAVCIEDTGHDLGVRGYGTPKQTAMTIRQQSVEFMTDLLN